jgi:hypothetical protein
MMGGNLQNN